MPNALEKSYDKHAVFVSCSSSTGTQIPHQGWLDVKKALKLRSGAYCWKCNLPLDPLVDCHKEYKVGKGLRCPFEDIVVHVCWVIRHHSEYRKSAAEDIKGFSAEYTQDEYAKWLSREDDRICNFHNGIELFLWFLHKYRPYVLDSTLRQEAYGSVKQNHVKSVSMGHLGMYTSPQVYLDSYTPPADKQREHLNSEVFADEMAVTKKIEVISNLMEILVKNCPVCWALGGVLHPHTSSSTPSNMNLAHHRLYSDCTYGKSPMSVSHTSWLDLKKKIRFKQKNQYCYSCHLPLGPRTPSCHVGVPCNKSCPFSDIVVHIAWVIRNSSEFWTEAVHQFKLQQNMSINDYSQWLATEGDEGVFHNGLEICYWFVNRYRRKTQ
jgi:hypothetical protein